LKEFFFRFGDWVIDANDDPYARILTFIDVQTNNVIVSIFSKGNFYRVSAPYSTLSYCAVTNELTRINIYTTIIPTIASSRERDEINSNWRGVEGVSSYILVLETLDLSFVRKVDQYTLSKVENLCKDRLNNTNSNAYQDPNISYNNNLCQALSLFYNDKNLR